MTEVLKMFPQMEDGSVEKQELNNSRFKRDSFTQKVVEQDLN